MDDIAAHDQPTNTSPSTSGNELWDCIVVGGGAAGLSTALVLGRARKRTLVIDAGEQSNLPTHGIGGLLGHDGRPPAELYQRGRDELAHYPSVEIRRPQTVTSARTLDADPLAYDAAQVEVVLADGTVERSRRIVLALGMDYRSVDLPGVRERWGRSVFHCPFCHGWEARDGRLAVLDSNAATAVHRALLLAEWSDDVTLLTNGALALGDDDLRKLSHAGITVDQRPVERLDGPAPALERVVFADGTSRACDGVLIAATLHQRGDLAEQLGLGLAAPTPVVFDAIAVDPMGTTNVPAVVAAGDVAAQMPSITLSIAAGTLAGTTVVRTLMEAKHANA